MASGIARTSTPDAALGNAIDVEVLTVNGSSVDRQRMRLGGLGDVELADVKTADPASNAGGLVVRAVGSPAALDGAVATPVQVTAANTATPLLSASLASTKRLIVQCDPDSAERVRIGDSNVGAARGLVIDVGQSMELDCGPNKSALLYVWSAAGTGKVNIMESA